MSLKSPLKNLKNSKKAAYVLFGFAGLATSAAMAEPLATPSVINRFDWKEGAPVADGGLANRYGLSPEALAPSIQQGKLHTQIYPVEITGLLPPYRPLEKVMKGKVDEVFEWIGLNPYPHENDTGIYSVPFPDGVRPTFRIGLGTIETPEGTGFTLSCATCHSSQLFGKTVLGLTNRFPRANEAFLYAKKWAPHLPVSWLRKFGGATPGEQKMFERVQDHLRFVGVKAPAALGLDTSLAQVALSLSLREQDDYATPSDRAARHPRPDLLDQHVADSKPAVWWNLKFKNRWLSDGSVVSGNPIYTNLLWNEIGRGVDLRELEGWLDRNSNVIRDLTSAVFSSEAPRFTDFFPAESLDLSRARRGEAIFNQRCNRCHGTYEKAWNLPRAATLSLTQQLETTHVHYHAKTPVIDVGTDPCRYQGMVSLQEKLNPLAISRRNGIVIQAQKGYVPPPLVGIWARWPYFHNNSAPSLCAVLSRHERRPVRYQAVEANDPERDFDSVCNGYPTRPLGTVRMVYDTTREGMHNTGHDEGIIIRNGKELLSSEDKLDLLTFLKTL